MKSELTGDFLRGFRRLPLRVQSLARKSYKLWKRNPRHPSLDFKRVGTHMPIYSVRVGIGWRALGVLEHETVVWFWVGSHTEYDKLLKKM